MKTIVVGLGNPILTDDGVGVKVAYALEDALTTNTIDDLTITEASVGGLRLMELMVGFDRAIIIDAIISNNEKKPGTYQRLSLDDLRNISPTQHSASAHDTSLVTALEMGQQMGLHLPEQILIYAIEVENVNDFCEEPTPSVAEAIPIVTEVVLQEIQDR
jgi:hydrogenase maturation protease